MAYDNRTDTHVNAVLRRVRARASSKKARRPGSFRDVVRAAGEISAGVSGAVMDAALDRRGSVGDRAGRVRESLLDAAAELVELAERVSEAGEALKFGDPHGFAQQLGVETGRWIFE